MLLCITRSEKGDRGQLLSVTKHFEADRMRWGAHRCRRVLSSLLSLSKGGGAVKAPGRLLLM